MDLGVPGRKAIVCASSRGLGRACGSGLQHDHRIGGRRWSRPRRTSPGNRRQGDRRAARRPGGAAGRLSRAGHPGEQQRGPRRVPGLRPAARAQMLDGVEIANMVVAVEFTQKVMPMTAEGCPQHRQHRFRLGRRIPLSGLDCPPVRAQRHHLHGRGGALGRGIDVTINFLLPGPFDTDRHERRNAKIAASRSTRPRPVPPNDSAPRRVRRGLRLPVLGASGGRRRPTLLHGGAFPGAM